LASAQLISTGNKGVGMVEVDTFLFWIIQLVSPNPTFVECIFENTTIIPGFPNINVFSANIIAIPVFTFIILQFLPTSVVLLNFHRK